MPLATEFRLVNTGIGLTRSFLELTQDVIDKVIGATVSGLNTLEGALPDVPMVSRPGAAAAYRGMLGSPGRMRALNPGSSSPTQIVEFADGERVTVI